MQMRFHLSTLYIGGITCARVLLQDVGVFYFYFQEEDMYNKVDTNMNFVEREKEIEKF